MARYGIAASPSPDEPVTQIEAEVRRITTSAAFFVYSFPPSSGGGGEVHILFKIRHVSAQCYGFQDVIVDAAIS